MKQLARLCLLALLAIGLAANLAGCGKNQAAQAPGPLPPGNAIQPPNTKPVVLHVDVPCAFSTCFPALAKEFTKTHPNVKISSNVANVEVLVQQLKDGDKPDLFMCVGDIETKALADSGIIADSDPICYIYLGLVTKKGNPHHLEKVEDLATDKVKTLAIGTPETSVGYYAEKILKQYKLWDKVQDKLVRTSFPITLLQFAKSGKVDAALAYGACINEMQKGQHGSVPGREEGKLKASLQLIKMFSKGDACYAIECPGCIIKGCKQPELAREFLDFLQVDPAQELLKEAGFVRLDETKCY